MAVNATRKTTIVFTGDVVGTEVQEAAANAASPGMIEVKTLASGANTITVPTMAGFIPTAVSIRPPTGNATSIILKGVTGDTGVRLHNTDPGSYPLDSSVTSFVLTAGASIVGVRFIWT